MRLLLAAALMIALHPGEMSAAQQTAGSVAGTVSIASADGQSLVMPGLTITMTCAGIDPKVSADQRGHGIGTSLDVYTKSGTKKRAEAAEQLENAVLVA